jgi:hypothetical protein
MDDILVDRKIVRMAEKYSSTVRGNDLDKVILGLQKLCGFVSGRITPIDVFGNLLLHDHWFCSEGKPWLNAIDANVRPHLFYSDCN